MIKPLLKYWRNSLADESLMGDIPNTAIYLHKNEISKDGFISASHATSLRTQWSKRAKDNADEHDQQIPVVLRTHGMCARHSHGATAGSRSTTCYYPMHIPATLGPDGRLSWADDTTPWIGREFLNPVEHEKSGIPVVGGIADFDRYLDQHPLNAKEWSELIGWCDGLWTGISHGKAPPGFQELDDFCIYIADGQGDPALQIRILLDALLERGEHTKLLSVVCEGNEPVQISPALRTEQLAAPRGSMSPGYGLADSQRDAVVALTRLEHGNVLAVNGPPGTGKTTLLQSIIATEVVRTALAGGNPSVIFGTSTNNQAVQNINKAMNEVLKKNEALVQTKSGHPKTIWIQRWIEDVPSYGLYLPSRAAEESARAQGFCTAIRTGKNWGGFPSRETNDQYVAKAEEYWLERFGTAYHVEPTALSNGVATVRENLGTIQTRINNIAATINQWDEFETWWRKFTGGRPIQPQDRLDEIRQQHKEHEGKLEDAINSCSAARMQLEAELNATNNQLRANHQKAHDGVITATKQFYETAEICRSIRAASVASGLLELLAEVTPLFRNYAATRQHNRMADSLNERGKGLFRSVINVHSRAAWISAIAQVTTESQATIDEAQTVAHRTQDLLNKGIENSAQKLQGYTQAIQSAQQRLSDQRRENSRRMQELERAVANLQSSREAVKNLYNRLRQEADSLNPGPKRPDLSENEATWVAEIDRVLDVTLRHELFQKAMRYWEGRWILEAKQLCKNKNDATKQSREEVLKRFRRWSMLTPCIISTLHLLPRHMQCAVFAGMNEEDNRATYTFPHLFEGIDLLIIDEAGQVAPHVGMAAFGLAKKAVVVGDVYQLEPISKITPGIDRMNSFRVGLKDKWKEGFPTIPHFISESEDRIKGSVMRIVQRATQFTSPSSPQEPGIFLAEHRRCDSKIIGYCNDLVYDGRLIPLAKLGPKAPEMRAWGWAHVRGTAQRVDGSWVNEMEARAIADWVAARALGPNGWLQHYRGVLTPEPGKEVSLNAIVAIVTPFKKQAAAIKSALQRNGSQFSDIIVGTVDALQGAECPIVIFSPTYSSEGGKQSSLFMIDDKRNRLNVAVSRAKDSFVVIGDMRQFRKGETVPSELLAKYIFAEEGNEIIDCGGNHCLSFEELEKVNAKRISTLEGHREALAQAICSLRPKERLIIVSPFISLRAIEDDKLADLCKTATLRGAVIHAFVDTEGAVEVGGRRAQEAVGALRQAGVAVHTLSAIHNKTLIVGDREIIEGSFNWLSAVRDPMRRGVRHEASWRICGTSTKPIIEAAVSELVRLGAKL